MRLLKLPVTSKLNHTPRIQRQLCLAANIGCSLLLPACKFSPIKFIPGLHSPSVLPFPDFLVIHYHSYQCQPYKDQRISQVLGIVDVNLSYSSWYTYVQDAKRLKAHEHLEAETIKASVLRHRLATFPHKLRAEVSGKLRIHVPLALHHLQHALQSNTVQLQTCME